jgi:ribonucleotide reductase beta subunit family protein with ferritin-like domain
MEDSSGRLAILPIQHPDIWEKYKKLRDCFWIQEEIFGELAKDGAHWAALGPDIQHFIKHILAFFAVSDAIVNKVIGDKIAPQIKIKELEFWYHMQEVNEDIHNATYSELVMAYISDESERDKIFHAVENFPVIKNKIDFITKYTGIGNEVDGKLSDKEMKTLESMMAFIKVASGALPAGKMAQELAEWADFVAKKAEERAPIAGNEGQLGLCILTNIITEGLFFSSSFCAIFWVYHQYRKLPGLTKANEFISRDEGLHTQMGIDLFRHKLAIKPSEAKVAEMMQEAVGIEIEFVTETLPVRLLGMNANLMIQYVKFVADTLMIQLGYKKIYNEDNPFPFMYKMSTGVRITDFFADNNVSEYVRNSANNNSDNSKLDFSEDF